MQRRKRQPPQPQRDAHSLRQTQQRREACWTIELSVIMD
jgi:hypothetical protein